MLSFLFNFYVTCLFLHLEPAKGSEEKFASLEEEHIRIVDEKMPQTVETRKELENLYQDREMFKIGMQLSKLTLWLGSRML